MYNSLVKENITLFTQNFVIAILVLITIYIDLILRMNQAVYVNLSVKTVITFFMECPLYDNIRTI